MSQNNSNNFAKNNKSVAEFYRDSNIFITGTTGFIGKSLIEKLLRTCNHLDGIYLLIRGKNGKSAEERFQTILSNSVRKFYINNVLKLFLNIFFCYIILFVSFFARFSIK